MFDLLKGLIMLTVLFIHTYGIDEALSSAQGIFAQAAVGLFTVYGEVSMPAMFIISGYGFRKTDIGTCLKKQFKALMIPYCISGAIAVVLHTVFYYLLYGGARTSLKLSFSLLIGLILGVTEDTTINGFTIYCCGPIWFLFGLFMASSIFNLLLQKLEGKWLFAAVILTSCAGWGLSFAPFIPWCVSQGLITVFFVYLGYFAKKSKVFTREYRVLFITGVSVLCIALYYLMNMFFGTTIIAYNKYAMGPLSIIMCGVTGLVLIYLFLLLNRVKGPVSSVLRVIGRYSLYVLCIHTVELAAVGRYLHYDFVNSWKGNVWVRTLIVFGCRAAVVLIATFCFVKLHAWLGKAIPQFIEKRKNGKESGNGGMS